MCHFFEWQTMQCNGWRELKDNKCQHLFSRLFLVAAPLTINDNFGHSEVGWAFVVRFCKLWGGTSREGDFGQYCTWALCLKSLPISVGLIYPCYGKIYGKIRSAQHCRAEVERAAAAGAQRNSNVPILLLQTMGAKRIKRKKCQHLFSLLLLVATSLDWFIPFKKKYWKNPLSPAVQCRGGESSCSSWEKAVLGWTLHC